MPVRDQPEQLFSSPRTADVPDVVVAALRERQLRYASLLIEGGIHVVHPVAQTGGGSRVCVLRRVHLDGGFAEIMLVHTAPELATVYDVVLLSGTAAPHPVVVQTDLRGVVFLHQVGEQVGCLPSQELSGFPTGTPLTGLVDRRWEFKASEGARLRALTSDCVAAQLAKL